MNMVPAWFVLLVVGGGFFLMLWRFGGRAGRRITVVSAVAIIIALGLIPMWGVRIEPVNSLSLTDSQPFITLNGRKAVDTLLPSQPRLERDSTDGLDPDVFPSERSAVLAGARMVLRDLARVVPDGVELREVNVTGVADDRTRGDLTAVIQRRLPAVRVTFTGVAESQPAESSRAALRVEGISDMVTTETRRSPSKARTLRVEGMMDVVTAGDVHHAWFTREVKLRGAAGEVNRTMRVMTKGWVEDPQSVPDGPGPWLVADPGTLASTQEQALDAARRAAAEKLEPLIRARATRRPGVNPSLIDAGRGRGLIEVEVSHGLIRDSFVQKFSRPAGDVYRAALLLDVSEPQMERLTRAYASTFSAERTRLRQSVLSGAGLILVILLVYWFLNAATKGYYVWALRVACTVLLMAGLFTVLLFA